MNDVPSGCFAILLPTDSEHKVLGYYFADKRVKFDLSSSLLLRLNLDHSKNEHNFLKLKDISFVSYKHVFKGKLARKAHGLIIGLLLYEEEKPEKFQSSLRNAASALEVSDFLSLSQTEFEEKLQEIYIEHLETLTDSLDPVALEESIKNRVKEMLSGSNKERKLADELLKKIQNGEHKKISEFYKTAEEALKVDDYDKATKFFKKSAEVADEFLEKDLTKVLNYKSKIANKIPVLNKNRDKTLQDAIIAIKNEDFNKAYIFFKRAAEISKELMEADKEEEYNLKSKALQDFYNADQKFKKK
ncbi:MAG: hypothetical protein JW891_07760 [Candidatus Lokiarchaeota archaeon]|nr:hypothetical protein [Candidatus Lokiarchaeota archaeon]